MLTFFLLCGLLPVYLFVTCFSSGSGDDAGDLALGIGDCGTGLETTLETKRLGSGDDSGDLADGE